MVREFLGCAETWRKAANLSETGVVAALSRVFTRSSVAPSQFQKTFAAAHIFILEQTLNLDYEDFLRQRNLPQWERENPLRQALIDRRCQSADEVAAWIVQAVKKSGHSGLGRLGGQNQAVPTKSSPSTGSTKAYPEFSANAALTLLAVACALLDRQVERLALDFENEGGFTERLYKVRTQKRRNQQ